MDFHKRSVALRCAAAVPYLLVLYLLQGVVFSRLRPWGVAPLLLPVAVCGAGLFSGRVYGCAFGILAGMLCDLSFNQPAILFTLLLAILGLSIGAMAETVLLEGPLAYGLVCLVSLALCAFVQTARLFFIDGAAPGFLLDTALRQTLVSLLFAVPLYFPAKLTGRVN